MKKGERSAQEIYCNDCCGFFLVYLWLGTGDNYRADIKCPNCGREHPRLIVDGLIRDTVTLDQRRVVRREVIHTTMATYQKKGRKAKEHARHGIMYERWVEKAATEQGEA